MAGDRYCQLLAEFLQEDIEHLSNEVPEIYKAWYEHSTCIDLPDHMRRGWARQVILALAEQLRTGKANPLAHTRRAGDNVINSEQSLYPIFSYMETQAFIARALAPFVWERFVEDPSTAEALLDRLEAAVQGAISSNAEAFLESFCVPHRLSGEWDVASRCAGNATARTRVPSQRALYVPAEQAGAQTPGPEAAPEEDPFSLLTGREAQIARLAATGLTNGEIAGRLGLKIPTIKSSLSRIFAKLGIQSRTELALMMGRYG